MVSVAEFIYKMLFIRSASIVSLRYITEAASLYGKYVNCLGKICWKCSVPKYLNRLKHFLKVYPISNSNVCL